MQNSIDRIKSLVKQRLSQKLAGGAFIALLTSIASAGLTFLMFALLGQAMSDEEYGSFASLFSLGAMLGITVTLGQPKVVLRFLSFYLGGDDKRHSVGVVRFSEKRILWAVAIVILVFLSIGLFANEGGERDLGMAWVGLLVGAYAFADYYSHKLRAFGKVASALMPRDVIWRGLVVFLALWAILSERKLQADEVIIYSVCSLGAVTFFQLVISSIEMKKRGMSRGADVPEEQEREKWKKATPGLALLAISSRAFQHLFVVAVAFAVSKVGAGHFFAAAKIATLLSLPLMATNMITAPMISEFFHREKYAEVQNICRAAVALAAPVTLLGFLILFFFGELILGFFGEGFKVASTALLILSGGTLFSALTGPTGVFMTMTGHENKFLVFTLVSNLAGLGFLLVLGPQFGIVGAAIGAAIAKVCKSGSVWIWTRHKLGIDPTLFGVFSPPSSTRHPSTE